ncbi:hypothetical protein BST61_g4124 [Cercospora zeina]
MIPLQLPSRPVFPGILHNGNNAEQHNTTRGKTLRKHFRGPLLLHGPLMWSAPQREDTPCLVAGLHTTPQTSDA